MKDLIIKENHLPATIKELNQFVLVQAEKLKHYRAKLQTINRLELADGVRKQTLEDGHKIGSALLWAEAKLGELLQETPKKGNTLTTIGGRKGTLPPGMSHNRSSRLQQLAANQDLIEEVLEEAKNNEDLPTRSEVLRKAKERERDQEISKQKQEIKKGLRSIDGLFDIIVIDPPWPYGTEFDPETRRVANPYPEMSIDDLMTINIPSKKDSIIWLWTTHQFIWDAQNLLNAWGFQYKAILTWDKEKMGMGNWLRMQCEFCLLGIKGKPFWDSKNIRDIIREPRREHSRKPESFYQMIDTKFEGDKLDYFSREERDGWKSFGSESGKFNGPRK